jgi:hypothetical protein
MFNSSEQRREASGRIKVRKAKPVDRTLFRNQGGRVAVANHGVIFDRYGQELPSANQDRQSTYFLTEAYAPRGRETRVGKGDPVRRHGEGRTIQKEFQETSKVENQIARRR